MIYLPIRIYGWVESKTSFNEMVLYVKDIFINGTYPHLWFLPALIIGIFFVGVLLRYCKIEVIVSVSLIFFIIGIMFSTYRPLIEIPSVWIIDYIGTRNGIFYGFVYVALGAWLAMPNSIVRRVDLRKWIVGFFLSMFALGLESIFAIFFLETQETILWFSVIPATICFFAITLKINVISDQKAILLRKASILMYTSHYLFIVLFMSILKQMSDSVIYHPLLFICVTLATIALSIIIVNASNSNRLLINLY